MSLHQVLLVLVAGLLIASLVFFLTRKLRAVNNEPEFEFIEDGEQKKDTLPAPSATVITPEAKPLIVPEPPALEYKAPSAAITQELDDDTPQPAFGSNLDILLNTIVNIILVYNEDKRCLDVWYNKKNAPIPELDKLRGKNIFESFDNDTAKQLNEAIEFVSANGQATTIKAASFIKGSEWLSLKIEPLFESNHHFTGNVTILIIDITEQRKREIELAEKRLQLADVQKLGRFGQWWYDIKEKQTHWAENLFALFEIDGLPKNTSHFDFYISRVSATDRRKVYQFFNNLTSAQNQAVEHDVQTVRGNQRRFKISRGQIVKNEVGNITRVYGIIQDITNHHSLPQPDVANIPPILDVRELEDNYRLALEGIKMAALSLNKTGHIIFCNSHLASMLGREPKQLIGVNWFEHFVPDGHQKTFTDWYKNQNIPAQYTNPVLLPDGSQRLISWQNTTVYDEHGDIIQTTSIGDDITQQQKDKEALIAEKEAAERAASFKSDFLSTMSHEIRTPMNAVIGNTNLLLEENPRADQLAYLNNLKFSGENLLGIINDILDYNKIEAGKLQLNKTSLNIRDLAQNIKQAFEPKANEKKLFLKLEIDSNIPKNLLGDPIRIGQILNNLISNGIKFTHKGGITILIREQSRNDKHISLNFTVADTGIGIDTQSLDKIFDPYVQEEHHRNYGGSGLGLAIIKKLIELHHTEIKVSSTLGKGTQFNFCIEFEYTAEPVGKPKLNPVQKMQEGNLSGMKVLVVDDNKMNIIIASRFLNKWNINISEANNGLVATQMVEDNDYDLIIMDLQMPIMDGFEATRNIKKMHPQLPVIALTADAMPETYAKVRSCGMDDYLTKPFMPEILFEKVSRHYKPQFN